MNMIWRNDELLLGFDTEKYGHIVKKIEKRDLFELYNEIGTHFNFFPFVIAKENNYEDKVDVS